MYFSCLHLVKNILCHLRLPYTEEGTQLQWQIIANGCSQKASSDPVSEMLLYPLPGTLHTSPLSKNPKHITCKCVLRVVLGVFCILPKHFSGIELRLFLRTWGTNGSKTLTWLWTLLSAAPSHSSHRQLSICSFPVKLHAVWRKYQISSAQENSNQGFYCVTPHTTICTLSFLTEGFSLESLRHVPAL